MHYTNKVYMHTWCYYSDNVEFSLNDDIRYETIKIPPMHANTAKLLPK